MMRYPSVWKASVKGDLFFLSATSRGTAVSLNVKHTIGTAILPPGRPPTSLLPATFRALSPTLKCASSQLLFKTRLPSYTRYRQYSDRHYSDSTLDRTARSGISYQGVQGSDETEAEIRARLEYILTEPCPQGVQGDERGKDDEGCAQFKIWLRTCLDSSGGRSGVSAADCDSLTKDYLSGRKTLADIFKEYETEILAVTSSSGARSTQSNSDVSSDSLAHQDSSAHSSNIKGTGSNGRDEENIPYICGRPQQVNVVLTPRQKLKMAVRDYGSMVMVFHIGCALISLGSFYLLVSSNVDVVALIGRLPGVSESIIARLESASTVGTFAVAYAAHKLTAPLRMGLTVACAPVMVRFLRTRGVLKPPKK